MSNGRRRKRYGPVHKRGIRQSALERIRKINKSNEKKRNRLDLGGPGTEYFIPAGTTCHIRKKGMRGWRTHTTSKGISCRGFLWRNQTHYGFEHDGYEIKAGIGSFSGGGLTIKRKRRDEPPAQGNPLTGKESAWDLLERQANGENV